MKVLNHSSLHHCPHVSSRPSWGMYCACQNKKSLQVMILRASSPPHHNICTASCCFVPPVYPFFSQKRFTSGSPLDCKTVCIVVRAPCRPVSTPCEDVCETFTQRGYEQLQEAALGPNQAENPLIPVVTIRCGMLTWYRTGWRLRWGGLVRRHSSQSWGFQP